jgi:integrase
MAKTEFNIWLERTARKPPEQPTRKSDGDGLYLLAEPNGSMYWRYDYRFEGKRRTHAIGRYPALSLAQARVRRGEVRDLLDKGTNPNTVKQAVKAKAKGVATETVEDAAKGWDDQNEQLATEGKRSPKTRARDERMVRYIVGAFGHKPVVDVVAKDLSDLLNIYNDAGSYATRIRIQSAAINIMGFAQGKGWLHTKPNPFVGVSYGKAYRAPEDEPRPAIVEAEPFGKLLRDVAGYQGRQGNLIGKALDLLTLTFVRPGTVAQAEWSEFDLDAALWIIPFKKLKQRKFRENIKELKGKPHFVPLSRQAVLLLRALKRQTGNSRFVFPVYDNQSGHITTEGMEAAVNLLGYKDVHCPHGFRSSASTLLNAERVTVEGVKIPRFAEQAIEFQLEHVKKDVAAIYNRDQRLPEREVLMQAWADMCDALREGKTVKAVKFKVVA